MNLVHLYLPKESEQDVFSMRWLHLIKQIDHDITEVRVYIEGLDFNLNDALHDLPYCIETKPKQKPKKKSYKNMWKAYMLDTGKAEDSYLPDYE